MPATALYGPNKKSPRTPPDRPVRSSAWASVQGGPGAIRAACPVAQLQVAALADWLRGAASCILTVSQCYSTVAALSLELRTGTMCLLIAGTRAAATGASLALQCAAGDVPVRRAPQNRLLQVARSSGYVTSFSLASASELCLFAFLPSSASACIATQLEAQRDPFSTLLCPKPALFCVFAVVSCCAIRTASTSSAPRAYIRYKSRHSPPPSPCKLPGARRAT